MVIWFWGPRPPWEEMLPLIGAVSERLGGGGGGGGDFAPSARWVVG